MRVIAGNYRSRPLKAPEGLNTRPTLDRVKEAMFNIISYHIENATVLDLFSGSGALGIEALSRGAKKVYFNDCNQEAYQVIKDNLNGLKINNGFELTKLDYLERIDSLNDKLDIVLLDPPYKDKIYEDIINRLEEKQLLSKNAIIIVEAELSVSINLDNTYTIKEHKYGNKKLIVIKK